MKIIDTLNIDAIIPDLNATEKKGIIEELTLPVSDLSGVEHKDMVRVLMERERLGSTGIGGGIGIPHGKLKGLDQLYIGFGLSRAGVNFEAIDGKPTHLFFLLLTPEDATDIHLEMLAKLSRMLKSDSFKMNLQEASDREAIFRIIKEEEESLLK